MMHKTFRHIRFSTLAPQVENLRLNVKEGEVSKVKDNMNQKMCDPRQGEQPEEVNRMFLLNIEIQVVEVKVAPGRK
jgi:hypothetical protein